jgi:hypothetical protein
VGGEFEPLFYCFVFYFEGWWIGMKLMERMRMRMRINEDEADVMCRHVWGFTELNGKRTHIRRFVIRKEEQAVRVRMVYDWEGELQS